MKTNTQWTLDPMHSSIGFVVRHLLITNVRGEFREVSGNASYDADDLGAASIRIEIPAASIDTRQAQRDEHLRSAEFFDAEHHPLVTFRSKRVSRSEVVGDLTMRGVTREVTLTVSEITGTTKDHRGAMRMGASGTARLKRSDFGMTYNRILEAGGVAIADDVAITMDLSLVRDA